MVLLVSVCCDTAQALVVLLVSMCCDTAQALVVLLVSVCCDTAQALVVLLVSVCCDTAQALVVKLVQFQIVSMLSGKSTWAPPRLTNVSPNVAFKSGLMFV